MKSGTPSKKFQNKTNSEISSKRIKNHLINFQIFLIIPPKKNCIPTNENTEKITLTMFKESWPPTNKLFNPQQKLRFLPFSEILSQKEQN